MEDLKQQIEQLLLARRDWVSSEELVSFSGLPNDRALRQVGDKQGLCSGFAISSDKGFKHVSLASTGEWLRFKHRLRKHGIQELCRVRDLDRARSRQVNTVKRHTFEKHTGQGVLL